MLLALDDMIGDGLITLERVEVRVYRRMNVCAAAASRLHRVRGCELEVNERVITAVRIAALPSGLILGFTSCFEFAPRIPGSHTSADRLTIYLPGVGK